VSKLAERSQVFDNHFVGSLPCMPARREIMAGRKEFLWRPWGGMEVFDPRMPRCIAGAGFNTAMVTDHYHYWEDFEGEEDYFTAKVFSGAMAWLDENANKGPFFLQVECFDVHEPFDVPEPYASMYTDGSKDDSNIWPPYQVYEDLRRYMAQATDEELAFLRSQYMGKVTMMDTWLGKFMTRLDALSLWEDTMVIFTTAMVTIPASVRRLASSFHTTTATPTFRCWSGIRRIRAEALASRS